MESEVGVRKEEGTMRAAAADAGRSSEQTKRDGMMETLMRAADHGHQRMWPDRQPRRSGPLELLPRLLKK
jgi:hypothetical protein